MVHGQRYEALKRDSVSCLLYLPLLHLPSVFLVDRSLAKLSTRINTIRDTALASLKVPTSSPVLTPDLSTPDLVLNGGDIHYDYNLLNVHTCLTQFYIFLRFHLIWSSYLSDEIDAIIITLILQGGRLRLGGLITCSMSPRGGRAVLWLGSVASGPTSSTVLLRIHCAWATRLGPVFWVCIPERMHFLLTRLQVINCLNLQKLRSQSECKYQFSSAQFSCSVVSDSLRPHGLQHTRPPCLSPTPGVYSNSCPLSWWCHPTTSSSVIPFSSHLQTFPASGSFQII